MCMSGFRDILVSMPGVHGGQPLADNERLDPGAGPGKVAGDFALALRQLRDAAGRPSFRRMASRAHCSAATLCRAVAGDRLPGLEVTLAFVAACDGDRAEWARRWRAAAAAESAARSRVLPGPRMVEPATAQARLAEPSVMETRAAGDLAAGDFTAWEARGRGDWIGWVRGRVWRQVALSAVVLVVTASGSVIGFGGGTGPAKQVPRLAPGWTTARQNGGALAEPSSPGSMDGDDPRARGCVADATVLQAIPIDLPGGTKRFGTLRLRHSDHCGTDWASAYYSNRNLYTITLISFRPADGAETRFSWSNNTPPGSYGNMLSTARGCVWVQATVTTPFGASKPVRTECLR
jgi:hypothetical protein